MAQCKPAEDALVAAELHARHAADETRRESRPTLTKRATDWMMSVAAYVVDPVASLFDGFRR